MATTASTLRTLRVGGQLDPAWLATATPWTHVRATANLSRPGDGAPVVDPTNGAHEHPTTTVETLTAAQADGQWRTTALKPTTSTGADLALQPTGLTWVITLEIKRGATWHEVIDYAIAPSGDRDYDGQSELITVAGDDCIDINALIPPPTSLPPGDAFETAVLDVLTDNPSAIAADLSVTRDATTVTVASSTGTDASLPAATISLAGQLTAADKTKLDATTGTNTGDQTATTVPVTPSGNLASATVQAGLVELQSDIDALTAGVADRTLLPSRIIYDYLKTSDGTVNATITGDITAGRLSVGDIIATASYYQGGQIGGATYAVVAGATGTDNGGAYINAGSLQLEARFGDWADVAQFGIKGTLTTDLSTQLQAFFDWCQANSKAATAPAGTWHVATTVTIKTDLTGAGVGRTVFKIIDSSPSGSAFDVLNTPSAQSGVDDVLHLRGFTCHGNKDNNSWTPVGNANYGLAIRSRRVIVSEVETCYVTANGMGVPVSADDVIFDRCYSHHNGKKGLHSGVVNRITVTNSSFHNNTLDAGIGFHQGATDLVITNNHCWSNGYGVYVGGSLTDTLSRHAVISGNTLTGNTIAGVYVNGFPAAYDANVLVTSNIARGNQYGIIVASATNVAVTGNIVTDSVQDGIRLLGGADVSISENILRGNSTGSPAPAIRVWGTAGVSGGMSTCRRIKMVGNLVVDTATSHSYGLLIEGDSEYVTVTGNSVTGIAPPNDIRSFASAMVGNVIRDNFGGSNPSAQGATAGRPTGLNSTTDRGFPFWDTTLGKPIWWNGTVWKDATGTTV